MRVNGLMILFLTLFLASSLARGVLRWLNTNHLRRHGQEVPGPFTGDIDGESLGKISRYIFDSQRFVAVESFFDDALALVILLGGVLPWLSRQLPSGEKHFLLPGLLFFSILGLGSILLGLPFDLYRTFVIEKRHGFSTITPRLWVTDRLKETALAAFLMGALLAALLTLLQTAPRTWWLWTWLVFASFQLLMVWIYPTVIAPLFNKYEPLRDDALRDAVVALMTKAGLRTRDVFQMDAGKRSRHTNAYFTGLGKSKRIVLFDTLIASHSREEILSVLAHEIGHWKKQHILQQFLFLEAASLGALWLASHLLDWPLLYETFGFQKPVPYAGLLLTALLLGPLMFLATPFGSAIQRRFEREADEFVFVLLGSTTALCSAMKRLARDNLANLHPHPLYAWFYYSHPPLAERIARLQDMESRPGSRSES